MHACLLQIWCGVNESDVNESDVIVMGYICYEQGYIHNELKSASMLGSLHRMHFMP